MKYILIAAALALTACDGMDMATPAPSPSPSMSPLVVAAGLAILSAQATKASAKPPECREQGVNRCCEAGLIPTWWCGSARLESKGSCKVFTAGDGVLYSCKPAVVPTPRGTPKVVAAPSLKILKVGLTQGGSDAFRACGVEASRIVQVIGKAAASAGTHGQDGVWGKLPYSAAADISVRNPTPWNEGKIKSQLGCFALNGWLGWYRQSGVDGWPASEPSHLHLIRPILPMKRSLQRQVHAWFAGRNGLVSNTDYKFWQPTQEMMNLNRSWFLSANPAEVPR